jgi:hypothetical protein
MEGHFAQEYYFLMPLAASDLGVWMHAEQGIGHYPGLIILRGNGIRLRKSLSSFHQSVN